MKRINLKSLSIDGLLSLRERINKAISARISSERRELETRLQRLSQFVPMARKRGPRKGSKVAPKYRNPLNSRETWSGRGRQPRWLTAALKTGKKIADFRIAGTMTTGKRRGPKRRKTRRAA